MTEEKPNKIEEKKKVEVKPLPVKKDNAAGIAKKEINKSEDKIKKDEKKVKSKKKEIPVVKKEDALVKGISIPISKKHAMYICSFIKNKEIEVAMADLGKVLKFKQAIPFKGEIPHRKGKIMSGRYPIKATKHFINLLKALKGNLIVNGLELEKTRIYIASASWAARPMRRGGRQAKRTNVIIKAKEFNKQKNNKGINKTIHRGENK